MFNGGIWCFWGPISDLHSWKGWNGMTILSFPENRNGAMQRQNALFRGEEWSLRAFASMPSTAIFFASTSRNKKFALRATQKFGEHEQASTRLNFASKSSKGKILRAVKNFDGPFITPLFIFPSLTWKKGTGKEGQVKKICFKRSPWEMAYWQKPKSILKKSKDGEREILKSLSHERKTRKNDLKVSLPPLVQKKERK